MTYSDAAEADLYVIQVE